MWLENNSWLDLGWELLDRQMTDLLCFILVMKLTLLSISDVHSALGIFILFLLTSC